MEAIVRQLLRLAALPVLGTAAWAQSGPGSVADLPLIELPADSGRPYLAVFQSGDGGWAELDRQVGIQLAAGGGLTFTFCAPPFCHSLLGLPFAGWVRVAFFFLLIRANALE